MADENKASFLHVEFLRDFDHPVKKFKAGDTTLEINYPFPYHMCYSKKRNDVYGNGLVADGICKVIDPTAKPKTAATRSTRASRQTAGTSAE